MFQRSQIPIGGIQLRDFPLVELLLAGKSDEIRRGFTIGWRQSIQPGADVAEFFNLLGQVLDGSLSGPDAIRIGLQRACAFSQRQVDCAHLLATKFVQQTAAFVTQDFIRDSLDLKAAVGVQRQKSATIEIDVIDRSAVRCEQHRVLLEAPLDGVAVRTLGESRDGDQRATCEIRLNQVGAVLWAQQPCRRAQTARPRLA